MCLGVISRKTQCNVYESQMNGFCSNNIVIHHMKSLREGLSRPKFPKISSQEFHLVGNPNRRGTIRFVELLACNMPEAGKATVGKEQKSGHKH